MNIVTYLFKAAVMIMNDHEFITQFEACTLPKESFTHTGHLRLAWVYLSKHSYDEAVELISIGIQRYADSLGASQKFHVTITIVWIKLVEAGINMHPAESFADFLAANPDLTDSKILTKYYSPACLNSEKARYEWVEPDLLRI